MESPARLEKITDYLLEHHAVKNRNRELTAMMCVGSVDVLIHYYELLAQRKAEGKHQLKVATIFSYTSNEEDKDAEGILDEGREIIGGEGGDPHTREKLDGFTQTLLREWAYGPVWQSSEKRNQALEAWLHFYNYHRPHSALGGQPPVTRLNNLVGNDT